MILVATSFFTVILWVLHLAEHGALSFFVLENVAGIMFKRKGAETSFGQWVLSEFRSCLPRGWEVDAIRLNSINCGLPQNRDRVFFVGTSPSLRAAPYERRVLREAAPLITQPPLLSFLDATRCDTDYEQLTHLQKRNVDRHLQNYLQLLSSQPGLPQLAIIDCERQPDNPSNHFDTKVAVGFVRTLRTKSASVWVLAAPSLHGVFGDRGRRLTREEKIRCCGFEPSRLSALSDSEAMHAIGNAIPPPLAGHVLFPLVRAWAYTAVEAEASVP